MITTTMSNISGCWLGTYWQSGQAIQFEATLVQGGNVVDGRILDANYLGESSIQGELLGHRIFFIKRYWTVDAVVDAAFCRILDARRFHFRLSLCLFKIKVLESFEVVCLIVGVKLMA